jgi:aspartate ammonia-lyase
METRIEKDFLGEVQVPSDAYYGVFTVRALSNFKLTGMRARPVFIKSLGIIKRSAAEANLELGLLEGKKAGAIIDAAQEVIAGKLDSQFPLDAYQAGAGTPFNMNCNEVIANRAIELLGGKRGDYSLVNPNNDVNMAQSSNDVIPTAIRIACVLEGKGVVAELRELGGALRKKGAEFSWIVKTGRTHLQDAVPLTLQQEFGAWASAIEADLPALQSSIERLRILGIGGTAIGTGINTHPLFRERIVQKIEGNSGEKFIPGKDPIELTNNMNAFLEFSAAMRASAITLVRIANDLKLLGSGPKTAIGELYLPEVEPGSSIMPGKINPSIPEAVEMAGYQVIANDTAVMLACKGGQLQLNTNTPLIAQNLLFSMELIANACRMFRELCIVGIKADSERSKSLLYSGLILATALNPYFGYQKMSELVKEALSRKITIYEIILEKKLLTKEQLDELLAPENLVGPREAKKL